ncbi:MAG: type II toxin-antitoxin system Phd/YefM family antitoxin [Patescibacteria group bacterium]
MTKLKKKQYQYLPNIISTSGLQRQSGKIIDQVKESSQPYIVVRNNKPQAVILAIDQYEELKRKQEQWEWMDTMEAIASAEKAKKEGKLKEFKGSMFDLWENPQEEKDKRN